MDTLPSNSWRSMKSGTATSLSVVGNVSTTVRWPGQRAHRGNCPTYRQRLPRLGGGVPILAAPLAAEAIRRAARDQAGTPCGQARRQGSDQDLMPIRAASRAAAVRDETPILDST